MLNFSIPQKLHGEPIAALGMSRWASNRLLSRGIRTVGQLDGMSVADVGGMPGVGAKCLDEIVAAVQRFCSSRATQSELFAGSTGIVESQENIDAIPVVRVPDIAKAWPISAMHVPSSVSNALGDVAGVREIGGLDGMSEDDLRRIHWVGAKGVKAIMTAIAALNDLPSPLVFRLDGDGRPLPPGMPLALFKAVESGSSPADEVDALLSGLSDRDAQLIRARWSRHAGRQTTLEEIAARHGITRERVRQILERHEGRLARSNLRLPRYDALAHIVIDAGGALPTHELERRAKDAGVLTANDTLSYLEALGELKLCARVRYDVPTKLWLTDEGTEKWSPGGRMAPVLKTIRTQVRRALSRAGCISVASFAQSPFGARHALSIALASGIRMTRYHDFLIPADPTQSVLARWSEQMLTIAPELSVADLSTGLTRGYVVHRGHRGHIEVPPLDVVREVLSRDPRFNVSGDAVSLAGPRPRTEVLTPTEENVVRIIESFDGVATWAQIMDAAKAAGCAAATASLVLSEPFVVRRRAGIYVLRGRAVKQETLKERIRERAASRREAIKRVSYAGGATARVVYQLTNFSLGGVLPVPSKLRGLATRHWRGKLPGGRELKLKMGEGFLWPLSRWFASENLKVGDLILADFNIPNAEIQFDVVS